VLAQDDLALGTGVDKDLARRHAEGNGSKAAQGNGETEIKTQT
jgi:predicted GIY-YIG superfamily endonuclease